jgi:hypothetical protein
VSPFRLQIVQAKLNRHQEYLRRRPSRFGIDNSDSRAVVNTRTLAVSVINTITRLSIQHHTQDLEP